MCHKKRNDPNYSKNITDRATVNRATFYAHFNDKYEILDYSLSMTILKDIKEALSISETLNGQIISKLFVSIAYYLKMYKMLANSIVRHFVTMLINALTTSWKLFYPYVTT